MTVNLTKVLTCSCLFLLLSSHGNTNQINVFVSGGANFSKLNNSRLLEMNEVVTNAYETKRQTHSRSFWAVGVNHTFEHPSLPYNQLSLGLAGYFFQLGTVQGTEYPFINEGLFDSLDYGFHAKSTALMVEAKALYSRYALKPYALLGIGPAWNKLYAYRETPSDPALSASPDLPFSNHSQHVFSYELGAGLQYLIKDDTQRHMQYHASAGYQYFNLDKGALGKSAVQTTSDRIRLNNLYTQGIICTLAVSFS